MNELNSKPEKPKDQRRFSQEQCDMLKRCSDKKDITEWNEWRKAHPGQDIDLAIANLEKVDLNDAHLEDAYFGGANLKGADLFCAHLEGAQFWFTHLEEAKLLLAHLQGAEFIEAHLEGACFENAIVDGSTLFDHCNVNRYGENDRYTDLSGVGLENVRIEPETKQLLEYNIRRKNWASWYPKQHWLLAWFVRKFWRISDYGISTKGIIKTFFKWAFYFAIVYYAWGFIDYHLIGNKDYPGIVSNLFVLEDSKQAVSGWLVPLRSVYFSIVTMTTLGFGDMYANAHSLFRGIFGHILLALQVTLGYVLLGALVTRFAVLFTAGGPAGKFADDQHAKAVV